MTGQAANGEIQFPRKHRYANSKQSSFLFCNWERPSAKLVQQHADLKLDRAVLATQRALMEKKPGEITMRRFALRKLRR